MCYRYLLLNPMEAMARNETSYHFEQYIEAHLRQRALPENLQRRHVFACNSCGAALTEQIVQLRSARGFKWLDCPVCGERVELLNLEERLASVPASHVQEMSIEYYWKESFLTTSHTLPYHLSVFQYMLRAVASTKSALAVRMLRSAHKGRICPKSQSHRNIRKART